MNPDPIALQNMLTTNAQKIVSAAMVVFHAIQTDRLLDAILVYTLFVLLLNWAYEWFDKTHLNKTD